MTLEKKFTGNLKFEILGTPENEHLLLGSNGFDYDFDL